MPTVTGYFAAIMALGKVIAAVLVALVGVPLLQAEESEDKYVDIGRLLSPVNLPIYSQGKLAGSAVVASGTLVDIQGEQDGRLKIGLSGNSFLIEKDIVKRTGDRRRVSPQERIETKLDWRANFPAGKPTAPGLPTGKENFPSMLPAGEREVLRLTNKERARKGIRPLVWSEDLARAARYHAADMAHDHYFNHASFDRREGRLVRLGIEFARIRRFDPKGSAENIALTPTDSAEEVVRRWMESPSHRENILNPANLRVGIGFCGGYWVQDFGW
jgi:uncharacterized protein YkwD